MCASGCPSSVGEGRPVIARSSRCSPIGRVEDLGALAIVGATTYALPGRARTATDLCTGRPVRTSGSFWTSPVAAFAGSRGLATIRESRSDDGPSAYLYEHAGTRQILYPEPDSFRAEGARIAGAYLDARSRLCVVVARRSRLTVEIYRHRAPAR